MMRRGLLVALVGLGIFCPQRAEAHELRPAVLALRETSAGRFEVRFSPVQTSFGTTLEVKPRFPPHCQVQAAGRVLDCGARGLAGNIEFPGLEDTPYRIAVRLEWSNGLEQVTSIGNDARGITPHLSVQGWSTRASFRDRVPLFADYAKLGVLHILSGYDHLCFVIGLLLLSGASRALVWTITAFTAAHSVTLAAALLGFARVPAKPVEAAIALSILLVATECTSPRRTLARRAPWLVAVSFGLLHGFGFAGALAEVGLPPHQRGLALLGFNVGVEVGQLAVIAGAMLLARAVMRGRLAPVLRSLVVYSIGIAAAFWTFERCSALL